MQAGRAGPQKEKAGRKGRRAERATRQKGQAGRKGELADTAGVVKVLARVNGGGRRRAMVH